MKASLRSVTLALLSLLAGCEDESPTENGQDRDGGRRDGGRLLSCEEADLLVAASLASDPTLIALRRCTTDSDCDVHDLPTVRCEDRQTILQNCAMPVARGGLDASVAFVHQLEARLCDRIVEDCQVGIACPAMRSSCVRGECEMVARDAADAGI